MSRCGLRKYDDGIGVITATSSLPMFLFEFLIRMLFYFVFALRPLQESRMSSVIGSVRGKQTSQRGKRQAVDVQGKYDEKVMFCCCRQYAKKCSKTTVELDKRAGKFNFKKGTERSK